ncbi:MAG: response regulator [Candidatus Riflebacteria bacterium]|nr:response regulator [Candidatus Riflebacteria bacterium]
MNPVKILIVEDEIVIAMDIKRCLIRLGFEVLGIITSGEEAIKKVGVLKPDMVLMDIQLSGKMLGTEAAKTIFSQWEIPVVYLTSQSDPRMIEIAKETMPFGFLLKPFDETEVKITIDLAVHKSKLERQKKESETELRKMELLQQEMGGLEKLKAMTKSIGQNFNDLLVGILGNTSYLLSNIPVDSKVFPFIQKIEGMAMQASAIADNLLSYSGQSQVQFGSIFLAKVISASRPILEKMVSPQITIDYKFHETLPIWGNDSQIRRILIDLIKNADEAIGEKGSISISSGTLLLDSAERFTRFPSFFGFRKGNYSFLKVSDTGCGISPEVREKIFDPFFTNNPFSQGLGLAVVHSIVQSYNGGLLVESEVGVGTGVTVFFPSIEPEKMKETENSVVEVSSIETPVLQKKRGTGLILDESPNVISVVKMFLRELGFETLAVSKPSEGISIFFHKKEDISFIITDFEMSEMNGREVLKKIREIRENVPVILSSNLPLHEVFKDFEKSKFAGFIKKPYRMSDFKQTIMKLEPMFSTRPK